MAHFPHGAFIAINEAKKRREEEKEEEKMTTYSQDELEKDWEFKIIRNESGGFRKPERFQQLLEEEAIAGWELVEKLDDRRVRFKRRKNARNNDHMLPLGIDPYRSRMGGASRPLLIGLVAGFLLLTAGLAGFFLFAENSGGSASDLWVTEARIPIALGLLFLGLIALARIPIALGLLFLGLIALLKARR